MKASPLRAVQTRTSNLRATRQHTRPDADAPQRPRLRTRPRRSSWLAQPPLCPHPLRRLRRWTPSSLSAILRHVPSYGAVASGPGTCPATATAKSKPTSIEAIVDALLDDRLTRDEAVEQIGQLIALSLSSPPPPSLSELLSLLFPNEGSSTSLSRQSSAAYRTDSSLSTLDKLILSGGLFMALIRCRVRNVNARSEKGFRYSDPLLLDWAFFVHYFGGTLPTGLSWLKHLHVVTNANNYRMPVCRQAVI